MIEARVIRPNRSQPQWDIVDLDAWLPGDHRARLVWRFVESLDLSGFYERIKSREGTVGRPAADPMVLLALWLYAITDCVGSARALERLVESDLAYRWLAGGVPVNYHGLSDFRVNHGDILDRLLTESVTALVAAGLVSLEEITIDGTKVRASASKNSFKSEATLERIEAAVEQRLAALRAEVTDDSAACSRRQRASKIRTEEMMKDRAAKAHEALKVVQAERAKRAKTHPKDEKGKAEPTVSLTDPEARTMRFSDGAMRPAYNAQIAVVGGEGVIVSVEMTDRRNDAGLAQPMVEAIIDRYGTAPKTLLVDTHYATNEDIAALAEHEAGPVTIYAPPPPDRDDVKPRTLAERARKRAKEPESVKEWRGRMASDEGKETYRRRMRIERINGDLKNHGFGFLPVRGKLKAQAIALFHALANNMMATNRLRLLAT
jgi:transposase